MGDGPVFGFSFVRFSLVVIYISTAMICIIWARQASALGGITWKAPRSRSTAAPCLLRALVDGTRCGAVLWFWLFFACRSVTQPAALLCTEIPSGSVDAGTQRRADAHGQSDTERRI